MKRWWILAIILFGLFLAELAFREELSLFSMAVPTLAAWVFAVLGREEREALGLTLVAGLLGELLSTTPPGFILISLGIVVWLLRYLKKTVLASTTWESRLVLLFVGGFFFSLGPPLFWLVGWFLGLLPEFPAPITRVILGIGIETASIAMVGFLFSRMWVFATPGYVHG